MKAKIENEQLVIRIPLSSLKKGLEFVLTSQIDSGKVRVTDVAKMGRYYAKHILDATLGLESEPAINELLDAVGIEAYENAESWISDEEEM